MAQGREDGLGSGRALRRSCDMTQSIFAWLSQWDGTVHLCSKLSTTKIESIEVFCNSVPARPGACDG